MNILSIESKTIYIRRSTPIWTHLRMIIFIGFYKDRSQMIHLFYFLFGFVLKASSVEISGTINFQMTWGNLSEEHEHFVIENGEPFKLLNAEKYVMGYKGDANDKVQIPQNNSETISQEKRHVKVRRRRWAPAPPADNYARHGPECIVKQRELAGLGTTLDHTNPRIIGGLTSDVNNGEKNGGVPGIAEAPMELSAQRAGILGNLLNKDNENSKAVETAPVAVEVGEDGHVIEKAQGIHIVIMVEEEEEARMACHYCEGEGNKDDPQTTEEEDKSRKSMIWYHLSRRKHGDFYKVKEVDLDMHDDPTMNNVYTTDKHTLVVKRALIRHQGTYFCRYAADQTNEVRKKISEQDLAKFFRSDDKLRFLYHLDVVPVADVKAKLVRASPEENTGLPMPFPNTNVSELNVEVLSVWQEWSQCSSCGVVPGTRRRIGECTVHRQPGTSLDSRFSFLGMLLALYKDGVPCRSSLFYGHEGLANHVARPDEVQEQECQPSCTDFSLSIAEILAKSPRQLDKGKIKEKKFVEPEGHSITLICPKAPLDMPTAWINGTGILIGPLLKRITGGRVWIDEKSHLHIRHLLPTDTNHYLCVVAGKIKGRIKLIVKPKIPPCKACRYALYLLLTYPINFMVFCVFVCVRHQEKKRNLNYELLKQHHGSFSTLSSTDSEEEKLARLAAPGQGGGDTGEELTTDFSTNKPINQSDKSRNVRRYSAQGSRANANLDGGDFAYWNEGFQAPMAVGRSWGIKNNSGVVLGEGRSSGAVAPPKHPLGLLKSPN